MVRTMKTIRIEIKNKKVYSLLRDLEELDVIRLINDDNTVRESVAGRYAGKLSQKTADELSEQVTNSRQQWETRTI